MTRVGIIGAGFMGTTHAAAWAAAGVPPVAVLAGPDTPPRVLADRYGATAHTEVGPFLEAVDVVDVCAPTHLHAEMVVAAAEAGKHVVCEKPLARTVEQAEHMVATCDAAGVHLLVAHVVRFFPEYAAAKAAIDDGVIGRPAVLRLSRATYQPHKAADNWFLDHDKSGGLVFDLMVHDLDQARWLAGDVTSVYARGVAAARPDAGVDHVVAVLRHEGGAISHVDASWAHPPPTFRTRGEVAGDLGVVSWDSDRDQPVRTVSRAQPGSSEAIPRPTTGATDDPYAAQIAHFLAVLRGETDPIVTAADGLAAVELATAVAASLASGGPVAVGEQRQSREVGG